MPPFVPRAISLPFRVDGAGRIAASLGVEDQIADRIRSVVGTVPGERVMRPGYGTPARRQLFDVNDPLRTAEIATAVRDALAAWEPAITVQGVDVEGTSADTGVLEITVRYELAQTGEASTATVAVGGTVTESAGERG